MIFKKGNKKILAGILGIVFLVFGFWLIQAPKAEAACAIDCTKNTVGGSIVSCSYDIDIWTSSNKICTVGDVTEGTAIWSTLNPCINNTNTKACRQDYCPSFNYQNEADCKIISASGSSCGTVNTVTGKWDASESKCIECSSGKENQIYGDTTSLTAKSGDNQFESACGADSACDEQVQGYACEVGKQCDASGKCVAAATCGKNPIVEIDPPSFSGPKTGNKTFSLLIKNDDAASCTSRKFKVIVTSLPSGWSPQWSDGSDAKTVYKTTASLSGGGSETISLKITPSATAAVGDYGFIVRAEDKDNSSKNSTRSGTYTITDCPDGITPGDHLKFGINPYVRKEGDTVNLRLNNIDSNLHTLQLINANGTEVDSVNVNPGDTRFRTHTLVSTDPLGIWVGKVAGTDCKDTALVIECDSTDDCSPQTCDLTTYTCVAAATQVCNSTNCSAAINNAPCQCGTLTTVAADMGKYCCAGNSLVYGSPSLCQVGACAAGPSPISAPLCQSALVAPDVGKLCGPTYVVTAGDVSANSWCCSAANGVAIDKTTCQNMDPACAAGPPPPPPGPSGLINPLKCTDIICVIELVINFLFYVAVPIVILMIIIAAFLFMTAGGDAQKISSAKNVITYTLIGLLVIILARALVAALKYALGGK